MKTLSRMCSILLVVVLLLSLFTGCSGSSSGDDEDDTENIESVEDADESEDEADEESVDEQKTSDITVSTYLGDSSGSETLYSTTRYTDGIPVESWTDSCVLFAVDGITDYSYYVDTAQYNSLGDLQASENHIITTWSDIETDIDAVTQIEYEYNQSGSPVSADVVMQTIQEQDGEEASATQEVNLTMSYDGEDQLSSVSVQYSYYDSEGDEGTWDLNLQFAENAVYRVMTVEYDEVTYEVLYKFDTDGNITEISCEGALSSFIGQYVVNILSWGSVFSGYRDSYLLSIITDGGSVSYQYNEQGDCTYICLNTGSYNDAVITYEYEYTYDDDGNLSRKIKFYEDEDYFLVTYYDYE